MTEEKAKADQYVAEAWREEAAAEEARELDKRRVAAVYISEDLLVALLQQRPNPERRWLTYEGIPEGAEFVSIHHDPTYGVFFMRVRHPSFEPVVLGNQIPVIPCIARVHTESRPESQP